MPRWKALPDELDPQVKEFAEQLRRLVDRSGLSITAVADRTGYNKTSWERFLSGRLLAPKGAIVALAEVTGTNPVHLTTMWELAERAWNRASTSRAALPGRGAGGRGAARPPVIPPDGGPNGPAPRGPRQGPGAPPSPAAALPPPVPQRQAPPRGRRRATLFVAGVVGALLVVAAAVLLTDPTGLTDFGGGGGGGGGAVAQSPAAAPSTSAPQGLPAGVRCSGADCDGRDPEAMGCGGPYATTVSSATVGTATVEVRYSETCGAVWARITRAAAGDTVRITSGAATRDGAVQTDEDAYTPMLPAPTAAGAARACATLTSGTEGCTTPN
ncbi:DUF2690 domain-containing protein [Streptomyces sp. NPDC006368]|uniref:helix-turn-helix domain-containing protein n=1 Tax=Streptomyces sp. NPDC006368 TaxID=3156760 RepID=UPI0033B668E7